MIVIFFREERKLVNKISFSGRVSKRICIQFWHRNDGRNYFKIFLLRKIRTTFSSKFRTTLRIDFLFPFLSVSFLSFLLSTRCLLARLIAVNSPEYRYRDGNCLTETTTTTTTTTTIGIDSCWFGWLRVSGIDWNFVFSGNRRIKVWINRRGDSGVIWFG